MNTIDEQGFPKNTIRLSEFEFRINALSAKTDTVTANVASDSDHFNTLKSNLVQIKNETEDKLNTTNQQITDSIKKQFKTDLDDGERIISTNNEVSDQLEKEIDELHQKILNYEVLSTERIVVYRRKQKELEELKHQYEILKEGFEDASKENTRLKQDADERTVKIGALETEIEDMKQVIAKLTDARVILNKYFSAHYENFTKEEKKLIQEVEGNVFPGHYNNNPVLPDVSGIVKQKPKENPNLPYTSEINEPNVMKSVRYENQEKPIKTILNE